MITVFLVALVCTAPDSCEVYAPESWEGGAEVIAQCQTELARRVIEDQGVVYYCEKESI